MDLIVTTIEPDSWAEHGGQGNMRTYETTLSLVVRQTHNVHEEIRDLLSQLRRLQDIQVTLAVRSLEVQELADKNLAKKLKAGQPVRLTPQQTAALLEQNTVRNAPKITLFNGQTLHMILPAKSEAGFGMDVNPVISADRRFVRMSFATNTQAAKDQQSCSTLTVKDGQSLLLDVTKFHDTGKGQKLLLVTPTIIVPEEEEELIGIENK